LSPLIAVFWALPVPIVAATHATLIGVVLEAAVVRYAAARPIPGWLREGLNGGPWRPDGAVGQRPPGPVVPAEPAAPQIVSVDQ
jgi:hypothetical protein